MMMYNGSKEANLSFFLQTTSMNQSIIADNNHQNCHETVFDDLNLLQEKEKFIYFLFDSIAMGIVLYCSMMAVHALNKTRGRIFSAPNMLMFCLSFSDSCMSSINLIFNFSLLFNKYRTCVPGFRTLVTLFFTASHVSYTLMILSGINRFLRIRFLLHYDCLITPKLGRRVILVSIITSIMISSVAEVGHVFLKKYGRFVVISVIDIPSLFSVLFLYLLSMYDLRKMKIQVANLPARIRVIIRMSSVHLVAACLVTFPFVTCFLVRRLEILGPYEMTRLFFSCMFFFKLLPLMNVFNVFTLNKRCRRVINISRR